MAEAAEINASLMALKTCPMPNAQRPMPMPSAQRPTPNAQCPMTNDPTCYRCLHARATAAPHVPFRDSTLTRVLQDALTDPKATTAVLACLSPACSHLELSLP